MRPEAPDPTGLGAEVERLVSAVGSRRTIARQCHVGTPGGERVTVPQPCGRDGFDPILAADLVARALDGLARPEAACAWVTRLGPAEPNDGDRAWQFAAAAGFGRHGLRLRGFWLVHRRGFVDLDVPP